MNDLTDAEKPIPRYWVRYYWSECVLCGRPRNGRERVYNEPKPVDEAERHIDTPDWACDSHFL